MQIYGLIAVASVAIVATANIHAGGDWAELSPLQPSPTSSSLSTYSNTTLHSTIVQIVAQQCKIVRKAIMTAVEEASNGPLIQRVLEKNVDQYETYLDTMSPDDRDRLFLDLGETVEQQRNANKDETPKARRIRRRQLILARYDSAMTQTGNGISALAGGNDYTRLLSQALLALFGQQTYTACDTLAATLRNSKVPISDAVITNETFYSYLNAFTTSTSEEFAKREGEYIEGIFNAGAFEEARGLGDYLNGDRRSHSDEAAAQGRIAPSMKYHPYFGPALTSRVPFHADFTSALDASHTSPLRKLTHLSRTLSKIVLGSTITHSLAIIREHFFEYVYGYNPLQFTRVGVSVAEKPKLMTVLEAIQELRDETLEGLDNGDESGAIQGRFQDEDLWYGIQRRQQLLYRRVRTYLQDIEDRAEAERRGEKPQRDMTEEELQGNYHSGELFPHEEIDVVDGVSIMAYQQPTPGEVLPTVPHADELFDASYYAFKGPTFASDTKFMVDHKGFSKVHAAVLPVNNLHRLLDSEDALFLYNPEEVHRQRVAEMEGEPINDKKYTSVEYLKRMVSSRVATVVPSQPGNDGSASASDDENRSLLMKYLANLAKEVTTEAARQEKRVELGQATKQAGIDVVESALLSGISVPRSLYDAVETSHSGEKQNHNGTAVLSHPQDQLWLNDINFLIQRNSILREIQPLAFTNKAVNDDHDEL